MNIDPVQMQEDLKKLTYRIEIAERNIFQLLKQTGQLRKDLKEHAMHGVWATKDKSNEETSKQRTRDDHIDLREEKAG